MFAVTGSTPGIRVWNSRMLADLAVAVTVTNLETISEFVISTARFSGALNDTVRGTSPVAVKLFKPVAVTLTVYDPSAYVC